MARLPEEKSADLIRLVLWLKTHELINIRALERNANVPSGALGKAVRGNISYLSNNHEPALAKILQDYGLQPSRPQRGESIAISAMRRELTKGRKKQK